jgi:hypothetical protein
MDNGKTASCDEIVQRQTVASGRLPSARGNDNHAPQKTENRKCFAAH